MSTREVDQDLEKILSKAFDEIKRKVSSMMARRERKLLKELKASSKKPREARDARGGDARGHDHAKKEEPKKDHKHAKGDYRKSRSSTNSEESA